MPSHKSAWSICRGARLLSAKLWSVPFFVTAALATGCATPSTAPSLAVQCPEPPRSVLIPVACPPTLEPMADDTMGAMANALMSAAETYHACRAAVIGTQ